MSFGNMGTMMQVASMGMQIFGTLQKGEQEQDVHQYNAAVNLQKAEIAYEQGRITQERLRKDARRFKSRQVAAYGASGVTSKGSPFQVLAETAEEFEYDMMIEDYNTRVSIINANSAAELDYMRGQQARSSSRVDAGTTLLTKLPSFIKSGNKGNIPTTTGGVGFGGGSPNATSFGGQTLNI